ncbi:MAG: hypothetical protein GX986_06370 [Firmicutes bacterium]|nr:hypothetical protein [Bacillota bacterium]
MRNVARIVSDQVKAHWEGEAARNQEITAIQDENIFWAQSIKMGAGKPTICSTVRLGLRDAYGSWKISCISLR